MTERSGRRGHVARPRPTTDAGPRARKPRSDPICLRSERTPPGKRRRRTGRRVATSRHSAQVRPRDSSRIPAQSRGAPRSSGYWHATCSIPKRRAKPSTLAPGADRTPCSERAANGHGTLRYTAFSAPGPIIGNTPRGDGDAATTRRGVTLHRTSHVASKSATCPDTRISGAPRACLLTPNACASAAAA